MSWFTESNRPKHFKYAILCGFAGTFLFCPWRGYGYGVQGLPLRQQMGLA